jgi:hypothetical protein
VGTEIGHQASELELELSVKYGEALPIEEGRSALLDFREEGGHIGGAERMPRRAARVFGAEQGSPSGGRREVLREHGEIRSSVLLPLSLPVGGDWRLLACHLPLSPLGAMPLPPRLR